MLIISSQSVLLSNHLGAPCMHLLCWVTHENFWFAFFCTCRDTKKSDFIIYNITATQLASTHTYWGTLRDIVRHYEILWDILRRLWCLKTLWDILRHYKTLWDVLRRYNITFSMEMRHYEILWDILKCFETFCNVLRHYETLWDILRLYDTRGFKRIREKRLVSYKRLQRN